MKRDHLKRRFGSIDEFAALSGLSRASVDRAVARDEIKCVRIGGRKLVPAEEFLRLLGVDLDSIAPETEAA